MSKPPNNSSVGPQGWRLPSSAPSLREVHRSVSVPTHLGFWRKMLAFSGPGYLVAVGYMDPGNWATDLAGGSAFGYSLLWVVLLSNLMAILLQSLCARLGIATGRDLAQACRDHYSKPVTVCLWLLCEIAICACDLAEVLGSAIALNLLFKIPLLWGVCLTALDVFAVMYLQNKGFRYIEALVLSLILLIGGCFLAEIIFSKPNFGQILAGFVPTPKVFQNSQMLYLAIGILGATVMPHNLYLHSSIVQTRKYEQDSAGKSEAIKFATLDSTIALSFALFINGAILVVSAATFHAQGRHGIEQIQEAFKLLSPMLGVPVAGAVFALALLASGQNSTLTGTLAGQIVMEGFLNIRLRPWLRRLITRLLAILPAVICTAVYAHDPAKEADAVGKLLIFSQVILSLQLSFAVIPLVLFTSDAAKMGQFVIGKRLKIGAWLTAMVIVILNAKYLLDFCGISQWFMRVIH